MTGTLDWIIVSNPESGNRKTQQEKSLVIEELCRRNSSHVVVEETYSEGFRVSFTGLLQSRIPRRGVLVIGGDGTVHEVANVIHQVNPTIAFGVLPAGTGNDFAIQIGVHKRSISELLTHYLSSEPVSIDIIKAQDRICLQILSTGFDAEVSERSRSLPRFLGNIRYIFGLLIELVRLNPIHYKMTIDGKESSFPALMLSCANGRNYGGGMFLSPNSDHQDGILELIVLHPVGRLELLRVFPKIFSGGHTSHPAFEIIPFRKLHLKAGTIAQGDGESICQSPLDLTIGISQLRTWKF